MADQKIGLVRWSGVECVAEQGRNDKSINLVQMAEETLMFKSVLIIHSLSINWIIGLNFENDSLLALRYSLRLSLLGNYAEFLISAIYSRRHHFAVLLDSAVSALFQRHPKHPFHRNFSELELSGRWTKNGGLRNHHFHLICRDPLSHDRPFRFLRHQIKYVSTNIFIMA